VQSASIRTDNAPVGNWLFGHSACGDGVGGFVALDKVLREVFCEEEGREETDLACGEYVLHRLEMSLVMPYTPIRRCKKEVKKDINTPYHPT